MESDGSIYLVVAGGEESSEDTTSYLDSVEILDLNSPEEGWKTGMFCVHFKLRLGLSFLC